MTNKIQAKQTEKRQNERWFVDVCGLLCSTSDGDRTPPPQEIACGSKRSKWWMITACVLACAMSESDCIVFLTSSAAFFEAMRCREMQRLCLCPLESDCATVLCDNGLGIQMLQVWKSSEEVFHFVSHSLLLFRCLSELQHTANIQTPAHTTSINTNLND